MLYYSHNIQIYEYQRENLYNVHILSFGNRLVINYTLLYNLIIIYNNNNKNVLIMLDEDLLCKPELRNVIMIPNCLCTYRLYLFKHHLFC